MFADEARKLVTQGIDPRDAKKAEKRKRLVQAANTFLSEASKPRRRGPTPLIAVPLSPRWPLLDGP
jgi:hypothetical protein